MALFNFLQKPLGFMSPGARDSGNNMLLIKMGFISLKKHKFNLDFYQNKTMEKIMKIILALQSCQMNIAKLDA